MKHVRAILSALLAAAFYAVNVPVSKLLLRDMGPAMMAALLYLGAGLGIGLVSLFRREDRSRARPLSRQDLPFVVGMIVLDIAAPILLMTGIRAGSSSSASLLGNFEIAATAVIALFVFHEGVSKRLWAAIGLITLSSALLSFQGADSLRFSPGSLLVLLAAACWGFPTTTRRLSRVWIRDGWNRKLPPNAAAEVTPASCWTLSGRNTSSWRFLFVRGWPGRDSSAMVR